MDEQIIKNPYSTIPNMHFFDATVPLCLLPPMLEMFLSSVYAVFTC